ncbi:hypothetical protein NPIL_473361 [Nephila pilipes]|uniref:Uncharacterized protein n=1 Tax=Nephila pilipes TaxID=299642 RepID=A0A8X6N1M4_NEPPI|nr:hypothetical protein NPIL_473361 [Nephila pilipes]
MSPKGSVNENGHTRESLCWRNRLFSRGSEGGVDNMGDVSLSNSLPIRRAKNHSHLLHQPVLYSSHSHSFGQPMSGRDCISATIPFPLPVDLLFVFLGEKLLILIYSIGEI